MLSLLFLLLSFSIPRCVYSARTDCWDVVAVVSSTFLLYPQVCTLQGLTVEMLSLLFLLLSFSIPRCILCKDWLLRCCHCCFFYFPSLSPGVYSARTDCWDVVAVVSSTFLLYPQVYTLQGLTVEMLSLLFLLLSFSIPRCVICKDWLLWCCHCCFFYFPSLSPGVYSARTDCWDVVTVVSSTFLLYPQVYNLQGLTVGMLSLLFLLLSFSIPRCIICKDWLLGCCHCCFFYFPSLSPGV
jgi:hypothetical protein